MQASQRTSRWTTGWAKRSLAVVLAVAAVSAAACGSDSPAGPTTPPVTATPVGSYDIQTVNGKSVPAVVASDGVFVREVTASSVSLGGDGKYSVVLTTRETITGNVSTYVDSTGGTWVQSGSAIQFTNGQDGSKDSATWDKGLLTFAEVDGTITTTFVYLQKK